jgi:catechol 2,3-dioxygenase-like lactoylglutathione lyase family enzyme
MSEFDRLADRLDQRMIDRRQLLKGLTLAAGSALVGSRTDAQTTALAPAMSINHVNVGVKDPGRSAEFYAALLGAKPQALSQGTPRTMYFPGATASSGLWISLSPLPRTPDERKNSDGWTGTPGIYTHVGFGVTIPTREFPRVAAEIKQRFPEIRQPNLFMTEAAGQENGIFDPDGTPIQLIQIEHNGTLTGYSKETGEKKGPLPDKAAEARGAAPTGLAPAMSINHVNIGVKDLKRSAEFYSVLLGAKPKASGGAAIQTMYLPGATENSGSWLSLTASTPGVGNTRKGSDGWDGTPGLYTHVGFGVAIPSKEFPRVAAEIKKQFPSIKAPNLFMTPAAGQECVIFDPDGTAIQLIQIEHQGTLTGYSTTTGEKIK